MDIEAEVEKLCQEFQTRDPDQLAEGLGLHIYEREDFNQLLGMYVVVCGRPCIFLKAGMDPGTRKMVLAHELGHVTLHQAERKAADIVPFTLFHMTERPEYEANIFAAHLLLDEEEIESLAKEGYDLVQMAQSLGVDINLLLIKLVEMRKKGYPWKDLGLPRSDYLGRKKKGD